MNEKSKIIIDQYENNVDAKKPGPKKFANVDLVKKELENPTSLRSLELIYQNNICKWIDSFPIILEGKQFTFDGHKYLEKEYKLNWKKNPVEVNMKGAQTGYTVKSILKTTHRAIYLYKKGVLYLFPTATDVSDFSRSRYSRLLSENEGLQANVHDTDSTNLKRIGQGYFYFRGMKSRTGLKSIPVDCVVFDEFDEMIPKTQKEQHEITSVEMALERMSHSEYKHAIYLSTPTLPDFGIHALFQNTTQHCWLIPCRHCGTYTCLEQEVIKNSGNELRVLRRFKNGSVIRACKKCGKEIYPLDGDWISSRENPSLIYGSHISQLNSNLVSPQEILEAYETHVLRTRRPIHGKPNEQEFWNSKLGWPFVSAQDRLTKEQIYACCGTHGNVTYDMGPCAMGIDQNNGIHVVILTFRMDKPTVLYLGIHKDWHELDYYMNAFKVQCCVVDALPEKRNARAFAERFPKRVWLNYYDDSKKGSYIWDEKKYQVNVDRTESLDESHLWISRKEIVLPKEGMDVTEKFVYHCHNIAKRRIEEKNGDVRYVYVKLGGPDHFRHAFNYAVIASQKLSRRNIILEDINIQTMITSEKSWDEVY